MEYKLLKIGTDAEIFWKNSVGDPVPSIGLLPGTKYEPTTITSLGNGFTIHEDNVMPEFGIPPATTPEEFSENISKMLGWLEDFGLSRELQTDISPAKFFLPSQLAHPQAQEFGCDPDWCVWTRKVNKVDMFSPIVKQLRTAAAHIHVSFTVDGHPPEVIEAEPLVQMLDLAFLPFLFINNEEDMIRRQLYGKAGAYRYKEYSETIKGIEYRVLSNIWIRHPKLTMFVFNQIRWVFDTISAFSDLIPNLSKNLQQSIDKKDLTTAKRLIREYGVPLPAGVTLNV